MANSELVYKIVYQIQGEQDVQKSINYVNSLTGDFKLLEQGIQKSGNVMGRQAKALVENAKQTQSVINRQEKLRSSLKRTDADYVRLTNSINKGKRSINEIDQVLSKYNKTTRRNQQTFRETIAGAKRTSIAYQELQSKVRSNSITEEEAQKESKRLAKAMSILESKLVQLSKKSGISASQLDKLKQSMTQARNSATSAGRAIQGVGSAFTGTTKVNSSANQLLLSFGDIAQDSAQFSFGFAQGARAIGNNIAFASEQVLILRQKMELTKKGSATFSGVIKELGTQFMGPVGVIFAINLAVTAITMFATRQEAAKRKAQDTTDKLKEQAQALFDLTSGFEIGGKTFGELTGFASALKAMENINKQTVTLKDRLNELVDLGYMRTEAGAVSFYGAASAYNEQYVSELESLGPRINSLERSYSDLSNQYKIFEGVSDEVRQKFVELSKEEEAQTLKSKAHRVDVENRAKGGREYYQVLDQLEVITGKISLAENQRALGLNDVAISEEEARNQLNELLKQIQGSEMDSALYADIIERIASGMSSVKEETKDASDEIDRLKRSTMAGLQLSLFEAERGGDPKSILEARKAILEERIKQEGLTEAEAELERRKIRAEYIDETDAIETEKRKAIADLRLLEAQDDELELYRVRNQILDQRIQDEKLSEEQIALERARIQDDFNKNQLKKAEEAYNERQKIISDSMKVEEQIMKSFVSSTETVNKQLVNSIQGTFQSLIPASKAVAIAGLAVEKALAIGRVIADTQQKVTSLRTEQAKLLGLAGATSFIAPVMSGEYLKGAGAIQASITSIKSIADANIAKIAAIGLFEAGAIAAGGGGGAKGGGGGGGGGAAGGGATGGPAFGANFRDVEQGPQFMPRDGAVSAVSGIRVDILADRKQLYAIVRQGEEEYRSIKAS